MNIQAVVFDLDGTLLDSLADIANAANWVLHARNFPTHNIDAYRYFVGDGVGRLLHRILPEEHHQNQALHRELIAEFIDRYHCTWNVESRLYDGIPSVLDELVQRQLALGVLSNKPHAATSKCVEYYLGEFPFGAVLGQNQKRPPKPDLTGAREILHQLRVAPQHTLYVGDTAVDMQTGCDADMLPVGVTWGFRDREELATAGARWIIDHPHELIEIVDQREQSGLPV